jgi:IS30 family transposase
MRCGDLVLGKRPSAVVTLVQRTSRLVLLVALPAGWRAEQGRPALTTAMDRLPKSAGSLVDLGPRQGDG